MPEPSKMTRVRVGAASQWIGLVGLAGLVGLVGVVGVVG